MNGKRDKIIRGEGAYAIRYIYIYISTIIHYSSIDIRIISNRSRNEGLTLIVIEFASFHSRKIIRSLSRFRSDRSNGDQLFFVKKIEFSGRPYIG